MEAINSEESEEDMPQYLIKTIYDWRREAVSNGNIEISRKSEQNSGLNLNQNSDKILRKSQR